MSTCAPDPLLSRGRLYSHRGVRAPILTRVWLAVAVAIASTATLAVVIADHASSIGGGRRGAGAGSRHPGDPSGGSLRRVREAASCCFASPTRWPTSAPVRSRSFPARARPTATATAIRPTIATRRSASSRTPTPAVSSSSESTPSLPSDGVGCMRYHPRHDHWHVLDFTHYQLRREADAKLVRQSQKIGFCLTDARPAFAVAGSPAAPGIPARAGCADSLRRRLDTGHLRWLGRRVRLALPGQQLDISGLETRALLPQLTGRPEQPAGRERRPQQRPPRAPAAEPGRAAGAQAQPRLRHRSSERAAYPAGFGATSTGSPAGSQWACGEGGVSRRYHSASSAPMQPVPAAVTAWR